MAAWLDDLAALPWLEIIKALAAAATAFVAWRALQNWRRQDRAKREADFLDHMTEAVHDFIGAMPAPVTQVVLIKIGMETTIPRGALENSDPLVAGAIEYVKQEGDDDGKRLLESLEALRPTVTRIRALATKGTMFKFPNYETCQKSIAMLVWQFDRIQALGVFIRNRNWYWQNEQVIAQLKKMMVITPEDIQAHLTACNAEIVTYAGETYRRIYS